MATRRVRTGCLKCRVRRRKCDEGKPNCQRCIDGGFECQYGTRLSFLPKNSLTVETPPSSQNRAATAAQATGSGSGGGSNYRQVQFVAPGSTSARGGEISTAASSSSVGASPAASSSASSSTAAPSPATGHIALPPPPPVPPSQPSISSSPLAAISESPHQSPSSYNAVTDAIAAAARQIVPPQPRNDGVGGGSGGYKAAAQPRRGSQTSSTSSRVSKSTSKTPELSQHSSFPPIVQQFSRPGSSSSSRRTDGAGAAGSLSSSSSYSGPPPVSRPRLHQEITGGGAKYQDALDALLSLGGEEKDNMVVDSAAVSGASPSSSGAVKAELPPPPPPPSAVGFDGTRNPQHQREQLPPQPQLLQPPILLSRSPSDDESQQMDSLILEGKLQHSIDGYMMPLENTPEESRKLILLKHWRYDIATWFDVADLGHGFGLYVSYLALHSQAILDGVLALSATSFDRSVNGPPPLKLSSPEAFVTLQRQTPGFFCMASQIELLGLVLKRTAHFIAEHMGPVPSGSGSQKPQQQQRKRGTGDVNSQNQQQQNKQRQQQGGGEIDYMQPQPHNKQQQHQTSELPPPLSSVPETILDKYISRRPLSMVYTLGFQLELRLEIASALLEERDIAISPYHLCIPPSPWHKSKLAREVFTYANEALILTVRVLELCYGGGHQTPLQQPPGPSASTVFTPGGGTLVARWSALLDDLDTWYVQRPQEFQCLIEAPSGNDSGIPIIIYTNGAGAFGVQLYHTAMILLLRHKPRTVTGTRGVGGSINASASSGGGKMSLLWHARQVCGMALNNDLKECWDFALIASLVVAAKQMSHDSQHQTILQGFDRIAKITSWDMSRYKMVLRKEWDLL